MFDYLSLSPDYRETYVAESGSGLPENDAPRSGLYSAQWLPAIGSEYVPSENPSYLPALLRDTRLPSAALYLSGEYWRGYVAYRVALSAPLGRFDTLSVDGSATADNHKSVVLRADGERFSRDMKTLRLSRIEPIGAELPRTMFHLFGHGPNRSHSLRSRVEKMNTRLRLSAPLRKNGSPLSGLYPHPSGSGSVEIAAPLSGLSFSESRYVALPAPYRVYTEWLRTPIESEDIYSTPHFRSVWNRFSPEIAGNSAQNSRAPLSGLSAELSRIAESDSDLVSRWIPEHDPRIGDKMDSSSFSEHPSWVECGKCHGSGLRADGKKKCSVCRGSGKKQKASNRSRDSHTEKLSWVTCETCLERLRSAREGKGVAERFSRLSSDSERGALSERLSLSDQSRASYVIDSPSHLACIRSGHTLSESGTKSVIGAVDVGSVKVNYSDGDSRKKSSPYGIKRSVELPPAPIAETLSDANRSPRLSADRETYGIDPRCKITTASGEIRYSSPDDARVDSDRSSFEAVAARVEGKKAARAARAALIAERDTEYKTAALPSAETPERIGERLPSVQVGSEVTIG